MDGNEKAREKLEAKHRTTFRFSVPNGHFSIGLVKQKMRNINGWIRKLNMTGSGMNATDMSLVFQYVVFKLNSVPYGLRNIHTYSQAQLQEAMLKAFYLLDILSETICSIMYCCS